MYYTPRAPFLVDIQHILQLIKTKTIHYCDANAPVYVLVCIQNMHGETTIVTTS
jgi:hypothetical protein